MTKDIEREHTKYLAELLEREVIKKVDFEDIVFKPEINAFHSNYLSARFMDNINFGWSSWQAAKAHEAKKLEGCVMVPANNTTIVAIEKMVEQQVEASGITADVFRLDGEKILNAAVEAARGGNE